MYDVDIDESQRLMCIGLSLLTWSVRYVLLSKQIDKHVTDSNKGHLKPP